MPKFRQFVLLTLIGTASLPFGAGSLQAQEGVAYTYTGCWKANSGSVPELREFFDSDARALAEAAISEGKMVGYSVIESVIPNGTEARCDFLTSYRYVGFPSDLEILTDKGLAKLKVTGSELREKVQSLGRRANTALWRMVDFTGTAKEGSYLTIDLMKTSNSDDWQEVESSIFKPMHEARIKAGERQAWSAHTLVMPRGVGLEYDAATVNVVPDLKSLGIPAQYAEIFKKLHPGKNFQEAIERTEKSREIVESNLYRAIVLIQGE